MQEKIFPDIDIVANLYDSHAADLFRYVLSMVRNSETAEDIVHDSFVNLIRHIRRGYAADTNFRALMFTIARNLTIDHVRKMKKRMHVPLDCVQQPDSRQSVEAGFDASEMEEAVSQVMERLDEREKTVFSLKKEAGMTYAEIGQVIGRSERTVKRTMRKILGELAGELRNRGLSSTLILASLSLFIYVITGRRL